MFKLFLKHISDFLILDSSLRQFYHLNVRVKTPLYLTKLLSGHLSNLNNSCKTFYFKKMFGIRKIVGFNNGVANSIVFHKIYICKFYICGAN